MTTEADVADILAGRFQAPGYAFLRNVADSTGDAQRWADAIAVSLWPSRGLELHGIEIKTDRRDWLRELKAPRKAERIYRYCDRWWLAVPDPLIVDVEGGELPATWGLLLCRGGKARRIVAAPKLKPTAMTRAFFCSLIRRVYEAQSFDAALARAREEVRAKAYADGRRDCLRSLQGRNGPAKVLSDIEKAVGAEAGDLANWATRQEVSRELRWLRDRRVGDALVQLEGIAESLRVAAGQLTRVAKDVDAVS